MTRSSLARLLAAAALLTASVAPGALATGLQSLTGKSAHGSEVTFVITDHSNPSHFSVPVLTRCTNGNFTALHVNGSGFSVSNHEAYENSLGDHYVSYDAHATNNGVHLAIAVTVIHRHTGVVKSHGTFNVSFATAHAVCDSGNVAFEVHS